MKLLKDLSSAPSAEATASKQRSTNCLDSVNTSGSPTTVLAKSAHRRISTTGSERIESTVTQPLCGSQRGGDQPVVIDAEKYEVKALLVKWKQGKTTWYLVKW